MEQEPQLSMRTGTTPRTRRQLELADFEGVFPRGVFPSEARIIECRGHVLVWHRYDGDADVPKAHRRIWRALSSKDHPDLDGSVSVMCVWGVQGTYRFMQIWDHQGEHDRHPTDDTTIKSALRSWWLRSGGQP